MILPFTSMIFTLGLCIHTLTPVSSFLFSHTHRSKFWHGRLIQRQRSVMVIKIILNWPYNSGQTDILDWKNVIWLCSWGLFTASRLLSVFVVWHRGNSGWTVCSSSLQKIVWSRRFFLTHKIASWILPLDRSEKLWAVTLLEPTFVIMTQEVYSDFRLKKRNSLSRIYWHQIRNEWSSQW